MLVLFACWEVSKGQNCAQGLEYLLKTEGM